MNTKKKLLIVTDSFLPRWDGISRVLKEIIPHLSKKYSVTVVAPRFKGETPKFKNVKIIRFPLLDFKLGDYTPAHPKRKVLKAVIKSSDIVWGQTIGPIGALSMRYAKRYKKPLLAYIHSVEWELFSKSLKRFQKTVQISSKIFVKYLYNKCDLLLVPSESTKEILQKTGITAKKEIVQLGVDIDKFLIPPNKTKAKALLRYDKNSIVIGYLGRFGREKDLRTLYTAFKSLKLQFKNIKLLLVGGKKTTLEEYIDSFEDITVVDSTKTPEAYYKAMDIYVLPSLTETTSLTTLEAMSTGLPVVCTNVGKIPEYVEHKKTGFIFPSSNVERLTLTLALLIKDAPLRKKVGLTARKLVKSNYSWDKTLCEIDNILARFG